ncbi:RNA polymerase sigma factor [Sporomusa malonica]|uniref:RNA polymerase sigma factor n=1 Tax=Sporomusa malonica TaxID=112901 RepID=A0A1W1YPA5_9FIRM|nr:RNA polymerase sigma factor [Sporomusa malonica]SMC38040.1 RNA polymerase sigma-70 factor, ECF subfamily [Sporomusa malonica]
MPDDENLMIAKAKDGDRTALNALVVSHWPYVYRLALAKTGNPDDAQEIAQDAFLRALAALPRYKEMSATFKTYLSRIALNLITDYYRKRGRAPQVVDIDEYNAPIIDTGSRPDEAVISTERRQEVAKLLALLPNEQRQVIELRIIQGVAVADAARIMGKSGAAVKMLQQRALKRLKDLFAENGITGGEAGAG